MLNADGTEALGLSFETPSCCLDVPVEGGDQAFGSVVLHLDMHGRGSCGEFEESGSPEDALVERREIYHQELDLDGSGRYPLSRM